MLREYVNGLPATAAAVTMMITVVPQVCSVFQELSTAPQRWSRQCKGRCARNQHTISQSSGSYILSYGQSEDRLCG